MRRRQLPESPGWAQRVLYQRHQEQPPLLRLEPAALHHGENTPARPKLHFSGTALTDRLRVQGGPPPPPAPVRPAHKVNPKRGYVADSPVCDDALLLNTSGWFYNYNAYNPYRDAKKSVGRVRF